MDISGVNRSAPAAPALITPSPVETQAQQREVIQAVKALNAAEMFGEHNQLQFQKDPDTHKMVVQVVNRETGELVSQIPPKYVLEMAARSRK
jgi:uncharacterized FlaG/YvyC family protein